jgi:hypothetical protein
MRDARAVLGGSEVPGLLRGVALKLRLKFAVLESQILLQQPHCLGPRRGDVTGDSERLVEGLSCRNAPLHQSEALGFPARDSEIGHGAAPHGLRPPCV